jgi:hypothetical protein
MWMIVEVGNFNQNNKKAAIVHRRFSKLAPNVFSSQRPVRHVLYPYPYGSSTVVRRNDTRLGYEGM